MYVKIEIHHYNQISSIKISKTSKSLLLVILAFRKRCVKEREKWHTVHSNLIGRDVVLIVDEDVTRN